MAITILSHTWDKKLSDDKVVEIENVCEPGQSAQYLGKMELPTRHIAVCPADGTVRGGNNLMLDINFVINRQG